MSSRVVVACLLALAGTAQGAEPQDSVRTALAACAAMQERFAGAECTAIASRAGTYLVTVKAATPDAMRVVFMRSLDVADGLCAAGNRVELAQQLEATGGTRMVRWKIDPPACGVQRQE